MCKKLLANSVKDDYELEVGELDDPSLVERRDLPFELVVMNFLEASSSQLLEISEDFELTLSLEDMKKFRKTPMEG